MRTRHIGVEALCEFDVALEAGHLEAGVGEAPNLLANGLDDQRGARSDVQDGDASPEVYERVAIHIDDDRSRGALGEDRHGGPHARRQRCLPTGHECN